MAPAIIYYYILLRDQQRDFGLHLFLPLLPMPILSGFALIALFRFGRGPYYIPLLLAIISLQLLYSSIILGLYTRRRWRRLFYIADQRAAIIIGKEALLEALAKYGEKISSTGYPRKRLHLWPTVSQRIERLQKDLR